MPHLPLTALLALTVRCRLWLRLPPKGAPAAAGGARRRSAHPSLHRRNPLSRSPIPLRIPFPLQPKPYPQPTRSAARRPSPRGCRRSTPLRRRRKIPHRSSPRKEWTSAGCTRCRRAATSASNQPTSVTATQVSRCIPSTLPGWSLHRTTCPGDSLSRTPPFHRSTRAGRLTAFPHPGDFSWHRSRTARPSFSPPCHTKIGSCAAWRSSRQRSTKEERNSTPRPR